MADPTGRYALTFNGEIYNHFELRQRAQAHGWKFRGTSDSEVLLACWSLFGESILNSLNGMFAFCVTDSSKNSAVLVRDRFGVKPLYYRVLDGGLSFASTPDSLAAASGSMEFDRSFIARGLSTWAYETDSPDSAFSGVAALPGGCLMRVDVTGAQVHTSVSKWYDFRAKVSGEGAIVNDQNAAERVRALLADSISLRMRADVPVGLSLSGGLDSSIIAALASEGTPDPVRAFSFSLGARDKETVAVDRVAQMLGASRIQVRRVGPPPANELRETLERGLLCQGAPIGGLSALAQFQVFRAAREEGVVVMLGGQGADEAFMGYRKYQAAGVRQSLDRRQFHRAATSASHLVRALAAEGSDVKTYARAAGRYLRRRPSGGLASHLPGVGFAGISSSPESMQTDDVLARGLPTLLRMEDRNSMAHSVESRHPFMDYRVMEFGSSLGSRLNVRAGYGKWILRAAFETNIPKSIAWARYKRGFAPGTGLWLELGVGAHLRDIIGAHRSPIADALDVPRNAILPGSYSDRALGRSGMALHEALVLAWVALTLSRPLPKGCSG